MYAAETIDWQAFHRIEKKFFIKNYKSFHQYNFIISFKPCFFTFAYPQHFLKC